MGKVVEDDLLCPESSAALLGPDGPVANSLKGFESRPQQLSMLRDIINIYNDGGVALIEAGTGTGKSMAYLLPAILWAAQTHQRTVISTNTINLQEQLIHKDIPLLLKALGVKQKAVLVKGMSNYLCLRKLRETINEGPSLFPEDREELEQIEAWSEKTQDGSKSDLPMVPRSTTWERVCAEGDTCTQTKCPYYEGCHFFKARKEAQDAQLLVANHHLLFADLSLRAQLGIPKGDCLLPEYSRIILDEAHNIEDVATDYFAKQVYEGAIKWQLAKLVTEGGGKVAGKLIQLRLKIRECYPDKTPQEINQLLEDIGNGLVAQKREVLGNVDRAFDSVIAYVQHTAPSSTEVQGEQKMRLRKEHYESTLWKESVAPALKELVNPLKNLVASLTNLEKRFVDLTDELIKKKTEGLRLEILSIANRLSESAEVIHTFIDEPPSDDRVRWFEITTRKGSPSVKMVDAQLNLAIPLCRNLFEKFTSIVLCSATLATNRNFTFIRQRLGLNPELCPELNVTENIYDSPFDYPRQALLAVPENLPSPTDPNYLNGIVDAIWETLVTSRGNAFVLFTSYSMMTACFVKLEERLKGGRMPLFKQGDMNRKELLDEFKKTPRAVLFGTDSFWEGVDVAGDALRCVILVKLPFQVPNEPIIEARCEAITNRGGNPFMEFSIPNAIVKFKQGFGRLIRGKKDRGVIVCLDTRLVNKSYGTLFVNSLPPCSRFCAPMEELKVKMKSYL
jgi:ATP-dependent DNA helicase DinG